VLRSGCSLRAARTESAPYLAESGDAGSRRLPNGVSGFGRFQSRL